jgi:hypothetical protein
MGDSILKFFGHLFELLRLFHAPRLLRSQHQHPEAVFPHPSMGKNDLNDARATAKILD